MFLIVKTTKSSKRKRRRRIQVLLADDLLMNAQTLWKVGKRACETVAHSHDDGSQAQAGCKPQHSRMMMAVKHKPDASRSTLA